MADSPSQSSSPSADLAFRTTPWTMVDIVREGPGTPRYETEVSNLCRIYWPAVYAFLRRKGRSEAQAADLAQGFFADVVLSRGLFQRARRERGRLRSLLVRALLNYEIDRTRHRQHAEERATAPLTDAELERLESQYQQFSPASPDQAFGVQWAAALLEECLRQTERYFAKTRQSEKWDAFEKHVLRPIRSGNMPLPQALVAEETGFDSAGSVANAVFTVRKQLRMRLEEMIAFAVEPDEYEAERLYFLEQLARGTSS